MTATERTNPGTVLIYSARLSEPEHEKAVHFEMGRRIARLLGMEFGGEHGSAPRGAGRRYLIPTDTIIGQEQANRLGLSGEADLFGGIAPHAFLPTKAITHRLHNAQATAPEGWSHAFSRQVQTCVLKGITAFSVDDARHAGRHLLQDGPIRVKPVLATAGRGQIVVSDFAGLEQALERQDTRQLTECGLVLEEHLDDVETFSVGQVRMGGHLASYVGVQSLTPDNHGDMVYGGSALIVTQGGFERLLDLALDDIRLDVIDRARRYDQAVDECYPALIASRRNYDVARGRDANGAWRTGVLEQSWRIGGASAAEVAAIETFHDHPDVQVVMATTTEVFGNHTRRPEGAAPLFEGVDSEIGPLSKFVAVKPYAS